MPAGTSVQSQKTRGAATKDPLVALDLVLDQVEPAIFIFKDLHPFLARSNFAVIRKLKDIALHLKNSFKTLILVSPLLEIPAELEKEITVLNLPLPTRDELGELLERILADVRDLKQVDLALDAAVDARRLMELVPRLEDLPPPAERGERHEAAGCGKRVAREWQEAAGGPSPLGVGSRM